MATLLERIKAALVARGFEEMPAAEFSSVTESWFKADQFRIVNPETLIEMFPVLGVRLNADNESEVELELQLESDSGDACVLGKVVGVKPSDSEVEVSTDKNSSRHYGVNRVVINLKF